MPLPALKPALVLAEDQLAFKHVNELVLMFVPVA